jgi:hypothetical protein
MSRKTTHKPETRDPRPRTEGCMGSCALDANRAALLQLIVLVWVHGALLVVCSGVWMRPQSCELFSK